MTSTIRARLTAAAFINGHLHQPGEEFALAEGQRGPHRTHAHKHEFMDVDQDQKRMLPEHHDEPLYEVWSGSAWVRPDAK